MGYDEVVFLIVLRWVEGEGAGLMGVEAICVCLAALTQECEHCGADVYGVGVEGWVLSEEGGEEATVSVAEDEGSRLLGEGGQVVETGALE